jgi:phage gp29-like protein
MGNGRETGTPRFAEPSRIGPAQTEIDRALTAMPDETLDAALEDILGPLLAAIDKASDFDDALARAANALPGIAVERLAGLLDNALFGAHAYGRLAE